MNTLRIVLAALMVMVMAQPATAEFYRYMDKHGNIFFTDDINKVPADQREGIQPYEGSESMPESVATDEPSDPSRTEMQDTTSGALEMERERLESLEITLNREFEALTEERAFLDEEQQKAVTPEQIKAYNEKIIDFNSRIQIYEDKRNAYSEQVTAFNEQATAPSPDRR